MAYTIKKTSGATVATVPDRAINKSDTSLALVGYKAVGFGVDTAENFVHLMEHFANVSPPENPIDGQLWFDTTVNTMKVYHSENWGPLTSTSSVSTDPAQGGVSGVYHCAIAADNTSVLLLFAGNKIIAAIASKDITQSHIPAGATIGNTVYPLQAIFPFGLQGGINLANDNNLDDATDYVFSGRVPLAEQAHFAGGGGVDSQVSGWTYLDLGPGKSIGLMLSNGQAVAAVASAYVLWADLPPSITVYVSKDHQDDPCVVPIQARFGKKSYKQWTVDGAGLPTFVAGQTIADVALFPGLTFADTALAGLNQTVYGLVSAASTAYSTSLATAVADTKLWVDQQSVTSQKVAAIETNLTTKTSTSSVASAIDAILASTNNTTAINDLKTQFTTAMTATSFGEALTKISTASSLSATNSQSLTDIASAFTTKFGGGTLSQAITNLYTTVSANSGVGNGWGLTVNSNGYVNGVEALNGSSSKNTFKVTTSRFVIGDNNIDFVPFDVVNGVARMRSVEVDTLKTNTAVVPVKSTTTTAVVGQYNATTGIPTPTIVVRSVTVKMQAPGYIEATFSGKQVFSNTAASCPWAFSTFVNGQALTESTNSGTAPGETVTTWGTFYAPVPGDYVVEVRWNAHLSVSIAGRTLFAKGFPFTS
jgi:hypothetical protein